MSFIVSLFHQCTTCWHGVPSDYAPISKKEDDFGIEEANAWIQSHPVDPNVNALSYDKVKEYARNVFADFKKVPFTSANAEILGNHLAEIAKQNNAVRDSLLDSIFSLNTKKPLISNLYRTVCLVQRDKY